MTSAHRGLEYPSRCSSTAATGSFPKHLCRLQATGSFPTHLCRLQMFTSPPSSGSTSPATLLIPGPQRQSGTPSRRTAAGGGPLGTTPAQPYSRPNTTRGAAEDSSSSRGSGRVFAPSISSGGICFMNAMKSGVREVKCAPLCNFSFRSCGSASPTAVVI